MERDRSAASLIWVWAAASGEAGAPPEVVETYEVVLRLREGLAGNPPPDLGSGPHASCSQSAAARGAPAPLAFLAVGFGGSRTAPSHLQVRAVRLDFCRCLRGARLACVPCRWGWESRARAPARLRSLRLGWESRAGCQRRCGLRRQAWKRPRVALSLWLVPCLRRRDWGGARSGGLASWD